MASAMVVRQILIEEMMNNIVRSIIKCVVFSKKYLCRDMVWIFDK
jgi:hypothetical protein